MPLNPAMLTAPLRYCRYHVIRKYRRHAQQDLPIVNRPADTAQKCLTAPQVLLAPTRTIGVYIVVPAEMPQQAGTQLKLKSTCLKVTQNLMVGKGSETSSNFAAVSKNATQALLA